MKVRGEDLVNGTIEESDLVPALVTKINNPPPVGHTHTLSQVTDAGDSAGLNVGTDAGTVAAGDHGHTLSAITDAGDAAALAVGTDAGTVAAGDHAHAGVYQPAGTYLAPNGDGNALTNTFATNLGPRDLLLYDDFNRADTAAGTLGTIPSGGTWGMRAAGGVNPAVYGHINDRRFEIDAGGEIVYAYAVLPHAPTRLGCRAKWEATAGAGTEATLCMAVSHAEANIITDIAIHVTSTLEAWAIGYIESGGAVVNVASGNYVTPLTIGTEYPFEILKLGDTVTVNFGGEYHSATSAKFSDVNLSGVIAFWEHYSTDADAKALTSIGSVWAGVFLPTGLYADLTSNTYSGMQNVLQTTGASGDAYRIDYPAAANTYRDITGYVGGGAAQTQGIRFGLDAEWLGYIAFSTYSGGIAEWMRLSGTGQLGLGVVAPVATAKFQIDSTTQGFLTPRMTTTQREAISTPAEGLEVYDLTLHKKFVHDGTTWQACW